MMRIPAPLLLIPVALWLAACGQSGDLYRPDKKPPPPETGRPVAVVPTPGGETPQAVAPEEKDKKKDEKSAGQPATSPAADSKAEPAVTSQPPSTTTTP